MYYKNQDYTARKVTKNGRNRYFIQFHGQVEGSSEIEVDSEMFVLYTQEFAKPLEKQRKELRRHLFWGSLDEALFANDQTNPFAYDFEEAELREDVALVLKTCTDTQKRRFQLYAEGHSFAEIARLEACTERAIRKSVEAVQEKIKKSFFVEA